LIDVIILLQFLKIFEKRFKRKINMKDITFPENAITKDFVEILYNENKKEIRLYFPKEAIRIREIIKEAQFKFDWCSLCWYMFIRRKRVIRFYEK
jgi:hypothetical protein